MNPRDSETKPSEMFMNSLQEGGVGNYQLTCGWCNRLHLNPDSQYYCREGGADEGDTYRKYCEEEYKKNPDKVVLHHNTDGVVGHYMNDILFVDDCPCNGLYRYEKFIWDHRKTIKNYLPVRQAQEDRWAEEELTLNKLAGIS